MRVMTITARLALGGLSFNLIQTSALLQDVDDLEALFVHGSTGEGETDIAPLADEAGVHRRCVPALRRDVSPRHDLRAFWELWRLIRRWKPDVVHTHASKAGILGRTAAVLARVPVRIHTYHGHVFDDHFGGRVTRLIRRVERLVGRFTTRIVTESEALAAELAGEYRIVPRERIVVIPVGLDLGPVASAERGHGRLRNRLDVAADVPLVGIMGRLAPIKGHDLFLDAAERVLAERPGARFVITGDGELRDQIAADVRRRGLEGVVAMTGWLDDLVEAIGDLDVVVLTSDQEGTPVSVVEALAAGVPVVATDVGGVRDVLGPELAAQLVPPRDAAALAAAMLRTLDDPPDLAAARRHVLAAHDIAATTAAQVALYRRLLEERGRR